MGHKPRKTKGAPHQAYLESGAFLRDMTRIGDASTPYEVEPALISPEQFSPLLSEEHSQAFQTLSSLLASGSLPSIHHFSPTFSFGQDVLTRDGGAFSTTCGLRFLEEPTDWLAQSFPLATDGSFTLYVLVADGRVAEVSREEEGVLGNWFPDLNAYLWAMVWLSSPKPKSAILEALSTVEGAEDYCLELEENLAEEDQNFS